MRECRTRRATPTGGTTRGFTVVGAVIGAAALATAGTATAVVIVTTSGHGNDQSASPNHAHSTTASTAAPGANNGTAANNSHGTGSGSGSHSSNGNGPGSGGISAGSRTGNGAGSNSGTAPGSTTGTANVPGPNSGNGSTTGSNSGSGSAPGSNSGNGNGPGSNNGQGKGAGNGTGNTTTHGKGSGKGNGNGHGKGNGNGTGTGSGTGTNPGTGNGSGTGTGTGGGTGTGTGTGTGSGGGTGTGSGTGSGGGTTAPVPVAAPVLTGTLDASATPTLTWTAVDSADSYTVYRDGTMIATTTDTSYSDYAATTGSHDYTVIANSGNETSAPSNTVTLTAGLPAPTNLTATAAPTGNIIDTVLGSSAIGNTNGPIATATFGNPGSVVTAANGDLYIADPSNFEVRRVHDGVVSTFIGNGATGNTGDGGPSTDATISGLYSLGIDRARNILYVVDGFNNRVRQVDLSTGIISNFAGSSRGIPAIDPTAPNGDYGPATQAQLRDPAAVAVAPNGDVYIADTGDEKVRKVDIATGMITTVIGSGNWQWGTGPENGPGPGVDLWAPTSVALDSAGNVYVNDEYHKRVRELDVTTGLVHTVFGTGTNTPATIADGTPGTSATLDMSVSIAIDAADNLYVADHNRQVIYKVTDGKVYTYAGQLGKAYAYGDGGPALQATLWSPTRITLDAAGNLYVGGVTSRIRRITAGFPAGTQQLTWDAVTGATSYTVYRDGTELATTSGTSYTDSTATAGQTYTYQVTAVADGREGQPATATSSATAPTDPGTPTGPPAATSWTTAAALPVGLNVSAGVTGPDGRIYIFGGQISGGAATGTVYTLTPGADAWTTAAPMPKALYDAVATVGTDGRIYVLGGAASGAFLTTAYAYTPATNTWQSLPALPAPAGYGAAATGTDGTIYFLGGLNSTGKLATAYAYKPGAASWTTLAALPQPVIAARAATGPDGRIYLLGGSSTSGLTDTMSVYDPATGTWTTGTPLPAPLSGAAVTTGPDGHIYIAGGFTTGSARSAAVYTYNTADGTWTQLEDLPAPMQYTLAALTGGNLYVLTGSTSTGGYPTTVYTLPVTQ